MKNQIDEIVKNYYELIYEKIGNEIYQEIDTFDKKLIPVIEKEFYQCFKIGFLMSNMFFYDAENQKMGEILIQIKNLV